MRGRTRSSSRPLRHSSTGQSKQTGQHFLKDAQIVREMIERFGIRSTDTIVDIGAGAGAITALLASQAGKVIAVENDSALANTLRKRFADKSRVKVIEQDIMQTRLPKESFGVVANIPFYITTPILNMLMGTQGDSFQKAVLLIDKGAAKGFTANCIRNARVLAWRMRYNLKMVRVVSRTHFSPPPKVDSALLTIDRKTNKIVEDHHLRRFTALAAYGLRSPDLPIHEALSGIFTPPQLRHLIKSIGADRHASICTLNEQQWGIVFQTMIKHVPAFRWPRK